MTRNVTVLSVLVLTALGTADRAAAQSFTVQGSATRAAGPDFATNVVGDPWDFSHASDYVYMFSEDQDQPGQSSWSAVPTVSNGVFSGVSRASKPTMQVQFEGIRGALNIVGKNGIASPIDTSRYHRISFRMRRSATPSSNIETFDVTWFNATTRDQGSVGAQLALTRGFTDQFDRYVNQSPPSQAASTGYHIYKLDLDHGPNTLKFGAPFSGTMRGLRLGLGNSPELVGQTIEVDWIRLTERGVATTSLAWSGFSGAVTLTATHQQTGDVVQIFPDDGSNTTTFGSSGSFTWDFGFLPPGTYTLTAASGAQSVARTLTIDAAPVVVLTDPDAAGGRDFATTVLGDAWDFSNVQDVLRYGRLNQVASEVYSDTGISGATTGNDPFVQMVDDWDDPPGSELRIDANAYHRLSFTLDYTDRKDLMAPTALGDSYGGVARVVWRKAGSQSNPYSVTQDIFVVDGGPATYVMDLAALRTPGDGSSDAHDLEPGAAHFWEGQVATLRVDINEAVSPRTFKLSSVRLARDDEPNAYGFFTVKWQVADALMTSGLTQTGGSDATVALYYDTDRNAANGRTAIASGIAATAGQYGWNVAGLGVGSYYIYIEVTDAAGNTQGRYSSGPVTISSPIAAPTDNDGDGMADGWETKFGLSSPSADGDGDGLDNLAEYQNGTNPQLPNTWYLSEGATGFFRERLALANPDTDAADVTIRYLRESGDPIIRTYSVPALGRVTVNVNEVAGLSSAAVSAVVTANAGGVVVERSMMWDASLYGGHTGKGVASPGTQWYLAEGEASFFDTFILLANATGTPAQVSATFLLEGGATVTRSYMVNANARYTIHANTIAEVAGHAFSTALTSTVPITVERAMYFNSGGRTWNGGTNASAVAAASTSWFVAEGRTGGFFDTFLLLANPNGSAATATVRYLLPGGAVVTKVYALPATSRTTIWVDAESSGAGEPSLADTDVSASITASAPIIVERAMYWPGAYSSWYEAHASAGVTATGTKWALAEGEVGGALNYQTYVLLANAMGADASVRVTVLRTSGAASTFDFTLPANSRLTKSAGEFGLPAGEKFGLLAESLNGVPIAVERAMYWDAAGQFWGGGTNETGVRLR